ncbi:MAG: SPOR domain-containing protein [Planctomycetota bacterium]
MKPATATALCLAALLALPLAGCRNSGLKGTALEGTYVDQGPTGTVDQARTAYRNGQYDLAYQVAAPIADDIFADDRIDAAYIAGLAGKQVGYLDASAKYLNQALQSKDEQLKTDAAATLGLVYSQQGRYRPAAETLLWAAPRMTGEDAAQAYYYAGIAQQKLGFWSQARTTLILARGATADAGFRQQIEQQIAVTGWTLQVGAFTDAQLAQDQAETVARRAQNMGLGLPRLVPGRAADGTSMTFVHVGQFTSYQSATRYRDQLGATGVIIRALAVR